MLSQKVKLNNSKNYLKFKHQKTSLLNFYKDQLLISKSHPIFY